MASEFEHHFLGLKWNTMLLYCFVMIFNTIAFFISYFILNDLSIVDIIWSFMFLIPNYILLAERVTVEGWEGVT